MIDCQKIKALAEQQLVGTDVFVVSCKVSPSNEVELLLDSDTSVPTTKRIFRSRWLRPVSAKS